jgi:hypothetical protein
MSTPSATSAPWNPIIHFANERVEILPTASLLRLQPVKSLPGLKKARRRRETQKKMARCE